MPDVHLIRPPRHQIEPRLCSEYVSKFYPDNRALFNVHVGPLNPRILDMDLSLSEMRALGVARPRCDAIVIFDDHLLLIECWLIPDFKKIMQPHVYRKLIPETPDFGDWKLLPIKARLVGPFAHAMMRETALEFSIEFVVYRPHWVEVLLSSREHRKRAESLRSP